ncbi:MAG TPA: hypothetical protein VEN79_01240 [Terriglobia bacterium]|nr:hypothetical protein [Terriglobia bacterium]
MMKQDEDVHAAERCLIGTYFPRLRRTVRKNLTRLTCAFLRLAVSVRFGYGGRHLTSVARVLPEGKKFKSSYKWLGRFLRCKYFDPSSLAECLFALNLGKAPCVSPKLDQLWKTIWPTAFSPSRLTIKLC